MITKKQLIEACEDDAVYILLGIEQKALKRYFEWRGLL